MYLNGIKHTTSRSLLVRPNGPPQAIEVELGTEVPIHNAPGKIRPTKPDDPAHLALPDPSLGDETEPAFASGNMGHAAFCIAARVHTKLLAQGQSLLVVFGDGHVVASWWQLPVGSRNVALHAARHDCDNAHAEGRQLDAQRVRVGVQGSFGGRVYGCEDVGHDASETSGLNDGALAFDQHRCEDLAEAHDGEDVCIECLLHLAHVDVGGSDSVVAASIVVEHMELATCDFGDAVAQVRDGVIVG